MNVNDFIFPVFFDMEEGQDMQGNGFFVDNYFITAAHVVQKDYAVQSDPYILSFGKKIYLNDDNLLLERYTVDDNNSETYETENAADIAIFKAVGIHSPFVLAEVFPNCGQRLTCNFHHRKPFPVRTPTRQDSFFWETTGIVQEHVPNVPNFFIATMDPEHPYRGSSGSPIFEGNMVYGVLHSGSKKISGFFSAAKIIRLIRENSII